MKIIASQDLTGAAPPWAAWNAVTEEYDGPPAPVGYGATREDAIVDLLEQLED